MRIYLPLLALFMFMTSCVDYRSYSSLHQEKMTDLNFAPREGNLDVFFNGESKPKQDYLRIGLVKKNRTSFTSNISTLMESMKEDALNMGADAVIVMGAGDQKQVVTDVIIEDTYSIPKESMWGIAIKYIDNVTNEGNVLKQMNVFPLDGRLNGKSGAIVLSKEGEITSRLNSPSEIYAYYHSLEYLMESENGWSFATSGTEEPQYSYHLLRQRKLSNGLTNRVKAKMRRDGLPGELIIASLPGHLNNIKMKIMVDENDRIKERIWMEADRKEVKATREYDANGKLLSEHYAAKAYKATSFTPFLRVDYQYLSDEEFSAELSKEQIVEVEP